MIDNNMNRVLSTTSILLTCCSTLYLCLILYDISRVLIKYWGTGNFIMLKASTVACVLFLTLATLITILFFDLKLKSLTWINSILLLIWTFFLSFGVVGIIW